MTNQPKISVGIMAAKTIIFNLNDNYKMAGSTFPNGKYVAEILNYNIQISFNSKAACNRAEIVFKPNSTADFFELKQVTIGVDFHWQQQEDQKFGGTLKLIIEKEEVCAINEIELEEYLKSVISSEMSATSSPDLLKAHAVISRSWLLAQIEKTNSIKTGGRLYQTSHETENEVIRWYDREDHNNFDVCADDHCQRYQGITKIHSEKALTAVIETCGEVLVNDEKICDARFSKCCGGISENFENVWEPAVHPYLNKVIDSKKSTVNFDTDLTKEENAEKWINGFPAVFCNTTNNNILTQVLPDFDQQTSDFFRWKVEYSQPEISAIIRKRSGFNFGEIKKLEVVKRGVSGRIIKLKIVGTKNTLTVGKELEIRKWLSESHLYSSAFIVKPIEIEDGIPQKFVLKGAGWGHGVGLCQIGAAVMGETGFSYKKILNHYFTGAEIKKIY